MAKNGVGGVAGRGGHTAHRNVREAHPLGTGCMASVSPSRSDPTQSSRAAGPVGTAAHRHRTLGQQFLTLGAS